MINRHYSYLWSYLFAATLVLWVQFSSAFAAEEPPFVEAKPAKVLRMPLSEIEAAPKSSDYVEINTLWQDFLNALRSGNIQAAYDCYEAPSQESMAIQEFAAQHHPATAYCEMLLSGVEESRLDVMENKAVMSHVPYQRTSTGAVAEIKVFMIKELGSWRLVTPSRWREAAIEADARTLLQRLHNRIAQFIKENDGPVTIQAFDKANPDFMASALYQDLGRIYYFEADLSAADTWGIHARPRKTGTNLRGFEIDADGKIQILPAARKQPEIK